MRHEKLQKTVVHRGSSSDNRGADLGLSSPCERAETSLPAVAAQLREVAKYTPGPWTIRHHNEQLFVIGSDQHLSAICEIRHYPENDANARLIATAPELVEALKTLERWISGLKSMYPEMNRRLEAGRRVAHTAIAKAEGR